MITNMGLGDSLLGVALPDMIAMTNVLLMRNAFMALPREIEEAAIIDGANVVQRLRFIGLPAVKGVLSVISILAFIGAWDDFLWPLLVLQSPNKLTLTVGLSCQPGSLVSAAADHAIEVVVGPEVIAGSTRLKAGTAQKLVLNTISTVSMMRLGKTYGGLMVDVNATNEKLRERVRRTVRQATGTSEEDADRALEAAGGSAKVAIVALLAGIDAQAARSRLEEAGGDIRSAVSG